MGQRRNRRVHPALDNGHALAMTMATRPSTMPGTPLESPVASQGDQRNIGSTALMMSASPDEGILLGSVRSSTQPPGRGTLITRGHPEQLIQVAWTDPP